MRTLNTLLGLRVIFKRKQWYRKNSTPKTLKCTKSEYFAISTLPQRSLRLARAACTTNGAVRYYIIPIAPYFELF